MKVFHCSQCNHLVFFESDRCVACGSALAFFPETLDVRAPVESRDRRCANAALHRNCNWAAAVDDPNPLCRSCRLTRIIPDLSVSGSEVGWHRLEIAKRRLVYGLLALGLPVVDKKADPKNGIAFEFRCDSQDGREKVLTGHEDGVITVNVAEAHDVEREKRRIEMHEPYRTLLGHFRHESGHYYWDQLVRDTPRLDEFRARFGDERADYATALKRHYEQGPAANWNESFVSSYASSHPWEDWAETWAHYMHMADTMETAATSGLALKPARRDEPTLDRVEPLGDFSALIDSWFPLTYILNNLNRGLGLSDGYPFVLSTPTIEKLRFVHETIASRRGPQAAASARSNLEATSKKGSPNETLPNELATSQQHVVGFT